MIRKFSSWLLSRIRRQNLLTIFTAVYIVLIGIFVGLGYSFDWTGFSGSQLVTTATTTTNHSSPTVTTTVENLPAKTLWDWMQFLGILLAPIFVTLLANAINIQLSRNALQTTIENQQETLLQTYLDKMSELLLEKELRKSKSGDEERDIARARTLTILSRLSPERKRSLIQFLYESNLTNIINLSEADLSNTDLSEARLSNHARKINLSGANLSYTNLNKAVLRSANLADADLSHTNLVMADLNRANLSGANLTGADLSKANLSEAIVTQQQLEQAQSLTGATLPNGLT